MHTPGFCSPHQNASTLMDALVFFCTSQLEVPQCPAQQLDKPTVLGGEWGQEYKEAGVGVVVPVQDGGWAALRNYGSFRPGLSLPLF